MLTCSEVSLCARGEQYTGTTYSRIVTFGQDTRGNTEYEGVSAKRDHTQKGSRDYQLNVIFLECKSRQRKELSSSRAEGWPQGDQSIQTIQWVFYKSS